MKVLIIGGGGREHALAWKCAAESGVSEVLVAPGNAGTATEPRVRNVAVAADDIEGLVNLARTEGIGLTIVGPEAPLVAGVVDAFAASGLKCFGPTRLGARLEGSKAFAKEFLQRHGIPPRGTGPSPKHLRRGLCALATGTDRGQGQWSGRGQGRRDRRHPRRGHPRRAGDVRRAVWRGRRRSGSSRTFCRVKR